MKKFVFVVLALLATNVFAQQQVELNDANAEKRSLNAPFTAIWVSDGVDLFLTQGTMESIAVSASEERYKQRLVTEVVNGTLKIYYDSKDMLWNSNSKRKLKAYVSFVTLNKLSADAGANVFGKTKFTVNRLEMKCSSGAAVFAEVDAAEIDARQNSGAEIILKGNVKNLEIDVNSGAMFKGYDLVAEVCSAKASSGGGVRVFVVKELNASANSGGGIHYKGEAVIKDLNVNSGGSVKRATK
jgi:hypothetical protein